MESLNPIREGNRKLWGAVRLRLRLLEPAFAKAGWLKSARSEETKLKCPLSNETTFGSVAALSEAVALAKY